MRIARRLLLAGPALLAAPGGLAPARAAAWSPDRPVRILIPYTPGAINDALGRLIGERFQEVLGQPGVVENRPGASGSLAIAATAGFTPKAELLIFNEGLVPETMAPAEAFARVLRHSLVRAAIERGAQIVRLPRLDPVVAGIVDARRLPFSEAGDGRRSPLTAWQCGSVRQFRAGALGELDRVRSWVPV